MRDEKRLFAKILILLLAFSFSACKQNANLTENSSSISSAPKQNSNLKIEQIDFANFTYPWPEDVISDDEKTFTLKNGEREFVLKKQTGVRLTKTEYGDVTGDGTDEALINMS